MTSAEKTKFEALVREHERMVYGLAYHLTQDVAAAEEVAQDVFVQLHRALPSLGTEAHVAAWLRKVTNHRAIDRLRAIGRLRESELTDPENVAVELPPHDALLHKHLERLVAALPIRMRQVLILRYQEDLGPEEIAEALEMPVNTVKSLLQRALTALRGRVERTLGPANL